MRSNPKLSLLWTSMASCGFDQVGTLTGGSAFRGVRGSEGSTRGTCSTCGLGAVSDSSRRAISDVAGNAVRHSSTTSYKNPLHCVGHSPGKHQFHVGR
jgi:hypothetical protein